MHNISAIFLSVFSILFLSACKTMDEPTLQEPVEATSIELKLNFENNVNGAPLKYGLFNYENAAGNTYMVTLLKYYISNIRLINDSGDTVAYNQFELIDASDYAFSEILLEDLPLDNYTQLIFDFGIDSMYNHDGDQFGDMDPINGMIWSWATGYIFFKHEGKFINASGEEQFLLFHYGTDRAFVPDITVPLTDVTITENISQLILQFDLDQVYKNPNVIDFDEDNNHQSVSESDLPWIGKIQENLPNAFSFSRTE